MKQIFVGMTAVTFLLTTGAYAADLPARAYTKAPAIIDPVYDWTGFYVGGNIGYSWGRSSSTQTFVDATSGAILSSTSGNFNLDGVIGGGQFGYNWQKNNWVFGLEADIQGSGQNGSGNATCAGGPATSTATNAAAVNGVCTIGHIGDTVPFNVAALPVTSNLYEKLEWFGTVRGRIGPTITPTLLAYVTGGLAYGEVRATSTVSGTNLVGQQNVNTPPTLVPFAASFGSTATRAGWTVGAGLEGVVSGNWTAKLEYIYVDLGTISGSFVTPSVAPGGAFVTARYSSHVTDNIVRIGLNYRWGAPVVAKY